MHGTCIKIKIYLAFILVVEVLGYS